MRTISSGVGLFCSLTPTGGSRTLSAARRMQDAEMLIMPRLYQIAAYRACSFGVRRMIMRLM